MSSPARHDVMVLGGGPAGAAAAIAARQHRLRVVLLERGAAPQPRPCAGWLGPAAVAMCQRCGLAEEVGVPFRGLRLRSWEFDQLTEVNEADLHGWIVEPAALGGALLATAGAAGAEVRLDSPVLGLELGEDSARAKAADGTVLEAAFVVLADGAASRTAGAAQLPTAQQVRPPVRSAHVRLAQPNDHVGVEVILGGGRALRIAVLVRHPAHTDIELLSRDEPTPAVEQLRALLAAGHAAGQLPRATGAPVELPPLAGAALELESHVGKRCLLVGDAGGFVSAFSHDGIYPALRSGWLAIETIAQAREAEVFQDVLATFSATWRAELADYLRLANTDLGLLLPMVFNNTQMSRRVARAFLLGQTF